MIRPETSKDWNDVRNIVKKAFETAPHTDGDEHNLVNRLRNSKGFIPELSLVAIEDDEIVGHIMFTKIKIENTIQLAMAPVSVLPEFQGRGIGGQLITTGHKIARDLGFDFSVVLGDNKYYSKFGYRPAKDFGISAPFDVSDEYFMALNLSGKDIKLNGTVEYVKEFFEKE